MFLSKIRFYLIDRRQGNQVLSTQYLGNACFTFHFINCYDDGESVVVDLASYDDINIINDLNVSNATRGGRDVCPCMVRRYVLPLNINKVGSLASSFNDDDDQFGGRFRFSADFALGKNGGGGGGDAL